MHNIKKYFGLIILVLLVLTKIHDSNFVKRIENISYDTFQSIFIKKSTFEDVVIVDVDEKSIDVIGQFPWRRDIFANLINKLNLNKVAVISFDIFFSEDDRQNPKKILNEFNLNNEEVIDSDQLFLESIKSSNVVLSVLGDVSDYKKDNQSKPKTNIIARGSDVSKFTYFFKNKITSLEKFNDAAKGIGNISYLDSQDGVLRSIPMLLKIDNDLWPSLSLETLRVFHNHKNILVNADDNGINEIKTRKYQIKTDPNTLVFVNYKKFNKQNYISAVDVIEGKINEDRLKDKIVLIGSSAQGLFDFVKIPNGKVIPGVETHAHLIENIVNNDFIIKNLSTKIIENVLLLLSLIIVLMIPNKINPKFSIIFYVSLIIVLISFSSIAVSYTHLKLPTILLV